MTRFAVVTEPPRDPIRLSPKRYFVIVNLILFAAEAIYVTSCDEDVDLRPVPAYESISR